MRLVSWNCNGALRKKTGWVDELSADVLVIQECEDPERSTAAYRSWAGEYLWTGTTKNKGIGIFARNGYRLERLDWPDDGLQSFLPCCVNGSFDLLGIWTKQANSPNFRYIGQLWKYLQLHKDRLRGGRSILAGDLNSNTCWDEWDRWWNHSDVVRELEELGIQSLYHSHYGERQGEELLPTLFHRRDRNRPYHVDYIFVPTDSADAGKTRITVGHVDDWLAHSDHMPLISEIGI